MSYIYNPETSRHAAHLAVSFIAIGSPMRLSNPPDQPNRHTQTTSFVSTARRHDEMGAHRWKPHGTRNEPVGGLAAHLAGMQGSFQDDAPGYLRLSQQGAQLPSMRAGLFSRRGTRSACGRRDLFRGGCTAAAPLLTKGLPSLGKGGWEAKRQGQPPSGS